MSPDGKTVESEAAHGKKNQRFVSPFFFFFFAFGLNLPTVPPRCMNLTFVHILPRIVIFPCRYCNPTLPRPSTG